MTKEIVCANGEIALCDDDDYPVLSRFSWSYVGTEENKYVRASGGRITGKQKNFYMHSLVCGGRMPDHKNHNTLDNRKENLRIATPQENGWNKKKFKTTKGTPPTSQYKGVSSYRNVRGELLWRMIFKTTKKGEKPEHYVRVYGIKTEMEAAQIYNREIVKYRGEFAWLNPLPNKSLEEK